ncbi:hypothetical protein IQ06DRAFT_59089 [Phaeosphaeriaceae sp. SRC1lsM3a]|nr:hypothetical protein IQ06DRAFT_59089 [Stagonospora sp. SRC1lsM3a]
MSQQSESGQYVWDEQYKRYKYITYDHTSQQWIFSHWAPSSNTRVDSGSSSVEVLAHPTTDSGVYLNDEDYYVGPNISLVSGQPGQASSTSFHRNASAVAFGSQLYGSTDAFSAEGRPESMSPAYLVRPRQFFHEGKVFAVIMNETAGATASRPTIYASDHHNSNINAVRYSDNLVFTAVRRFVVVRPRKEFCYACPIFTYGNRATTKPGLQPSAHGIVYTWGSSPQTLPGETNDLKSSVPVVMKAGEMPLAATSRVYYGILHPIQYNVKVKDIGYVPGDNVPALMSNWRDEFEKTINQAGDLTNAPRTLEYGEREATETNQSEEDEEDEEDEEGEEEDSEDNEIDDELMSTEQYTHKADNLYVSSTNFMSSEDHDLVMTDAKPNGVVTPMARVEMHSSSAFDVASNPRAYFKKGRVFMTVWSQPKGLSDEPFVEMARFAVVKPNARFSVCLRISTYSGQATTKSGVVGRDHAAVIYKDGAVTLHEGERLEKGPIEIKVENPEMTIDPMSRINFAKPYTVEHNVKIRNIGRIVGASVGLVDQYFAQSLGLVKP